MPRGDATGPMGMGPMSGRGMGYCAGFERPGFIQPGPGMGRGRGFGRGRGRGPGWGRGYGPGWDWRAPYYGPPATTAAPANEIEMLRNESRILEERLEAIQDRLGQIKEEKNETE